ncbi:MAG TPA: SAM-dependent methyltransferase [Streptosporangiaceae bacterium]|jgi:SAM-dependent methyltransferase|nr:SAM-dependent methyltransferase [Streptosporangiaceae bacterium]
MSRYAMLVLPSANRVYAGAAAGLAAAELAAFSESVLGGGLSAAEITDRGGVPYLEFDAAELPPDAAGFLAAISALYALFEVHGDMLRPVPLSRPDRYDNDLLTIQKYPGKTNEQFTRLLLNVTLLASASAPEMLRRRLSVLDPLCGRGTTLNQALMYGYDAAGIDLDQKDFEAYGTFIRTWLQRKRVKHRISYDGPVRREGKVAGRRLQISLAPSKQEQKAGQTQDLDVVCADTTRAAEFFRSATFDLVVTDAPYGIQHGSKSAGSGLARRPQELLAAAVPVWARLLRPGGAIGIAWNTLVAPREETAAIVASAGLVPVESEAYLSFRHRVDQAIVRDILVARKHLG